MDNCDTAFEAAMASAMLTADEHKALAKDMELFRMFFRLGFNARDNQPRKPLAALLRAPS